MACWRDDEEELNIIQEHDDVFPFARIVAIPRRIPRASTLLVVGFYLVGLQRVPRVVAGDDRGVVHAMSEWTLWWWWRSGKSNSPSGFSTMN